MRFTFNKKYLFMAILLFFIEVFIALFVRDKFIRPYFGDVLVVILIYCFVKSFFDTPALKVAIGVLVFSFIIEFMQYLDIVERLGLQNSVIANTLVGNYFAWKDMMAYVAGFLVVLLVENFLVKKEALCTQNIS
jgi:Protein of unknown function (DUF2809)